MIGRLCKDKLSFETAIEANRRLLEIFRKYKGLSGEKRWYQCNLCGKYHLTSQPKLQRTPLIDKQRKIPNL